MVLIVPKLGTQQGRGVSRLMIARLNRIRKEGFFSNSDNNLSSDGPRLNFNTVRTEEDPFPRPSLLDPLDTDQHGETRIAVDPMRNTASYNDLLPGHNKMLEELMGTNIDVFRTYFSAESPA